MLSQKEMFEHQIAQEKDELERYPAEEAEELALIYAARGIPLERGARYRQQADRQSGAGARHARPRGARPQSRRSRLADRRGPLLLHRLFRSARASRSSFSASACSRGVAIAAAISGVALFVVGAVLSLFSGRSALVGGLRMLLIGSAAAARDLLHRLAVQRLGAVSGKRQLFFVPSSCSIMRALTSGRTMEPKFAGPALASSLETTWNARWPRFNCYSD